VRVRKPALAAIIATASLALAIFVLTGCAHRSTLATWRLVRQDSGQLLVPPGVPSRAQSQVVIGTNVPLAGGPCAQVEGILEIRSHGKHARVAVFPEALSKQPQGWLAEWTAGLEQSGCIPKGAAALLAGQIVESVPLGLNAARNLLHPNNIQTGTVDLTGAMRLEVVSPILKEGTSSDAPLSSEGEKITGEGLKINVSIASRNLVGYETAWYAISSRTTGEGLAIAPQYAERHIDGKTELRDQPATNYLRFPSDAAFYRLFYKSGQTDYTAIVLAAHTWPELNEATKALADGSCEKLASKLCIAIPRRVAINPFISVKVNGADVITPWGSTLAQAIRKSGQSRPNAVLAHLTLERPYKGRLIRVEFDRNDPAILSMVLNGGESVSWKVSMARSSATHESARP
jgi:hypothetical protein